MPESLLVWNSLIAGFAPQMLEETATWFPGRNFLVSADGFFAPLAGNKLLDLKNAALYKKYEYHHQCACICCLTC